MVWGIKLSCGHGGPPVTAARRRNQLCHHLMSCYDASTSPEVKWLPAALFSWAIQLPEAKIKFFSSGVLLRQRKAIGHSFHLGCHACAGSVLVLCSCLPFQGRHAPSSFFSLHRLALCIDVVCLAFGFPIPSSQCVLHLNADIS